MSDNTKESRGNVPALEQAVSEAIGKVVDKVAEKRDEQVDLGPILRRWIEEKLPHLNKDGR